MTLTERFKRKYDWKALTALTLLAFLVSQWLPQLLTPAIPVTASRPLIWLLPAACVLLGQGFWRELHHVRIDIISLGLLVALLQIVIACLGGMFLGFGYSPYTQSIGAIAHYFPLVFGILAAREILRWRLAAALREHYGEGVALFCTWGVLTIAAFPISAYTRLNDGATAFEWIGRFWLPGLAAGLFATYLALRAGPLASFAYLGTMSAFEWYSPILPSLPWPVAALVGVGVPVFGVALIEQGDIQETDEPEGRIAWGSIAGAFALVGLVWFNTGVFGVQPAIVHGHSMEPTMYTGDVMVSEVVDVADLQIGEVIRFRQRSRTVLHRIIDISYDADGQMVYVTQGDNNSAPDDPVRAEDIEGRMIHHVPKVGWPVIALQRSLAGLASGKFSVGSAPLILLAIPLLLTVASFIPFNKLRGLQRAKPLPPNVTPLRPAKTGHNVTRKTLISKSRRGPAALLILTSAALLAVLATTWRHR